MVSTIAGTDRVGIVGAGILGLALARELQRRHPTTRVTVLEKEPEVARHQTGRNSGVVHAGIYYEPGSLKARLCVDGMRRLRAYCHERGVDYLECGKVIVALDEDEEPRLRVLYERGIANGVEGLELIGPGRLRELEPAAAGRLALHSPRTAIVDFAAVARSLADDVRAAGGEVLTGAEVLDVRQDPHHLDVLTTCGIARLDLLVNCAGLHADRVAALSGDVEGPRIIPFRGEYLRLAPGRRDLVRGLIYPVPDPRYPFLGVHLTRRVDGEVLVGPNAVLAFAREGYDWHTVAPRDLWETLRWPGFRHFAREHWRTGVDELRRSVDRRRFLDQARRYVPELRAEDVLPERAGVRAQAMDPSGALVDDFRITRQGRVVSVRNAPSPAATASLAIAGELADRLGRP